MLEHIERQLGAIAADLAALRAEIAAVREMVATRTAPPPPDNHPLRESMWQCAGCGTWTPLGQFHTCPATKIVALTTVPTENDVITGVHVWANPTL